MLLTKSSNNNRPQIHQISSYGPWRNDSSISSITKPKKNELIILKRNFIFQPLTFRCYFSFKECIWILNNHFTVTHIGWGVKVTNNELMYDNPRCSPIFLTYKIAHQCKDIPKPLDDMSVAQDYWHVIFPVRILSGPRSLMANRAVNSRC